jgi:DNA-binding response OmpR family regulator
VKVYLVDDDSEEAELFQDAMSKIDAGIEVLWHADVMEALDALIREEEQPDFLFLDLNIPKVSGKDMLRLMRQNKATSDVPVVIYSTSISRKDIEDTSIFNEKSYLQKPEDFQSLCQKLEEVVLTGA